MEASKKISVLVKDPGRPPRHVWISNTLENLQRTVGGYIETVNFNSVGLVVICNEEGRLMGLDYNCDIYGIDFVGTIVIAGIDGDEFGDLPLKWPEMHTLFPMLWEVRA